MPLSGRFSVRYSLSLQQQVNASIVGSVSSFASNAKGDHSFALQTSAEKSTHHFQEVWANEQILCCAKNVAHWTLRLVFGSNFINQIARILNKHCNDDGNDERQYNDPMTFVKFMTAQIFPHTATPTWIHHFSEYSLVCQHMNLTVSFGRCFREPVQLAPPYATILCFMMRARSRPQVQR